MRKLIFILLALAAIKLSNAQSSVIDLPVNPNLNAYHLTIGCNSTTIIIFPSPIIEIDRGIRELMTAKVQGFENILKLRATKKDFPKTNLHVFTAEGKVFAFIVDYIDQPVHTTYDLTQIENEKTTSASMIPSNDDMSKKRLSDIANKVRQENPFFSKRQSNNQVTLRLRTINIADSILFFGFSLSNNSNIPFDIDFIRFYIHDKQNAKRTSIQEQEINSNYKDTIQSIPAFSKKQIVVAVPKFTIPDQKTFVVELYEKNGGRDTRIRIANRHLLRAKPI